MPQHAYETGPADPPSQPSARQAAVVGLGWRMGSAVALPLRIAFFTSPMALVLRISRGHASVQLKIVRQRHTAATQTTSCKRRTAEINCCRFRIWIVV
jgi:hypothetical protein